MLQTVSQKLKSSVAIVIKGDFSSNDVSVLMLNLRPHLKNKPILLDLSNFVAHAEGRNQGISWEYVNSYVENLLLISKHGGKLKHKAVFKRAIVIKELSKLLKDLNLIRDKWQIVKYRKKLIDCLIDIVNETTYDLRNPNIVKCTVKRDKEGVNFCLNMTLTGPAITITPSLDWCCPLFDKELA